MSLFTVDNFQPLMLVAGTALPSSFFINFNYKSVINPVSTTSTSFSLNTQILLHNIKMNNVISKNNILENISNIIKLLTNNFAETSKNNLEYKFIEEIINENILDYNNNFSYYFKYLFKILKKSFINCIVLLNTEEDTFSSTSYKSNFTKNIHSILKNIILEFNKKNKKNKECKKTIFDCLNKYNCCNKINLGNYNITKDSKTEFFTLLSQLFTSDINTKIANFTQNIKNESDKKNIIIYLFIYFLRLFYNSSYLVNKLYEKYKVGELGNPQKYDKNILLLFFNVFDNMLDNKLSNASKNTSSSSNDTNNLKKRKYTNSTTDINNNGSRKKIRID